MRPRHVLFTAAVLCLAPLWSADEPAPKPLERIVFGSCCRQDQPAPVFDGILAARPELFLLIGDNIYGDTADMAELKARYAKQDERESFKKLRAACPILGTWDDHDYGFNDSGAEHAQKQESQQAFLDFFGVPATDPRRKQAGVYHAQVFGPPGKEVQVILLDTRYFRGPLKKMEGKPEKGTGPYVPNDDPVSGMLGDAQWQWLETQLKKPARVRIVASSVQLAIEEQGWEKWSNLPRERARFFKLLKDTGAGGVVVISGDRHAGELSKLEQKDTGLKYPLYDLTSSSLNQPLKQFLKFDPNRHRVGALMLDANFGSLTVDWGKDDPEITLQLHDDKGVSKLKETVKLSALQP